MKAVGQGVAGVASLAQVSDEEFRDAVKAQWGEKGVIDLTMGLQLGRMFPMVKAGLGYAKECRRVTVSGHNVDVVKQAA